MANTFGTYIDALLLSFCLQEHFLSVLAQDCTSPLGLTDGTVENSQLSALSYYQHFSIGFKTVSMKPEYARLNNHLAWCGSGKLQGNYVAVDFLHTVNISAIATQGFLGINRYYVQTYKVTYSADGTHWQGFGAPKNETVWRGNSDDESIVKNTFPSVVKARYVRVYPVSCNRHACIRMELYGCRNYTSKKNPVPGSTPTVLTPTVHNNSRTSTGSPQPPTTVLHSPGTSNSKPDPGGTSTVSTPTAVTSPGLSSVVLSHSSGKETMTTRLRSSTDQAEGPSTKPSTEQHPGIGGQIAQRSDKGNTWTPGTVTIVLIVVAAVLIVIGVPLLMLTVFHRHRKDKKRKLCKNGSICAYDIRLSEVDSCLCNKEIDGCAVNSATFGTDESHLLDRCQPCAV